MIPIVWLTFNDTPARARWDQDLVDWLVPNSREPNGNDSGAVIVYPSGENADQLDLLNDYLARFEWVVLLLTSDECSTFPVNEIRHDNIRVWVQTPRPGIHEGPNIRYLPVGCPAPATFGAFRNDRPQHLDVGFWGQVTHRVREEMVAAFLTSGIEDTVMERTAGFTQGIVRQSYLDLLTQTVIAPAPSGPCSADSFRLWEALEAGCIPIVDTGPLQDVRGRSVAGYPQGFWTLLLDTLPPFPVVEDWKQAPGIARELLAGFPQANNDVYAWYLGWKRDLRRRLAADVAEVSGRSVTLASDITVLVCTSPTPNNPSYDHLETTLLSIRQRLPDVEILLMIDGVRPEQDDRRDDYEEYIRRVLYSCAHHWHVTPYRFNDHLHQVEMTRRVLEKVDTNYILFVEHDTPLTGDIPFDEWMDVMNELHVDVIRTYHETVLQPEHGHLMGQREGDYLFTRQWSQRPHMARTEFYRWALSMFFTENAVTFIEDKMHSVAQDADQDIGMLLYAPKDDANIQRSCHLDARGDAEKFDDRLVF